MEPDKQISAVVAQTLRPYLTPEVKIIVGVSGGPDSIALLHLLKENVGKPNLVVAHLHHGLRPEADADARLVIQTAVGWGLPYVVDKVNVAALAKSQGWSLEEAGRYARYRFLAAVAAQEGGQFVAVGHHADDQAETVLMHLIRGSGLAGLRGMQTASALPGRPEMTLLRPLLGVDRADIEAYCTQHQLTSITDHTNADTTFLRNKVRHELLPLLTQYNPQIRPHLQQLAAITSADYALLEDWFNAFWHSIFVEQGEDWIALTRSRWLELPLSHKRLALRKALQALRPTYTEIGFRPIELARQLIERNITGTQMDLPGGLQLRLGYRRIVIAAEEAVLPAPFVPQLLERQPLSLTVPGQVPLGNSWLLVSDLVKADTAVIQNNTNPWVAYVDIPGRSHLFVRVRQPGERFQPLGMNGRSAKLKEVMINRKIARELRDSWPIVAVEDHLVWLIGHHQDERARVRPSSSQIVRLTCKRTHEK